MSSRTERGRSARPAVRRVGAVGHGQDDGGRAAGAGRAGPARCRGPTRRGRAGRAKPTGWTIISLPATLRGDGRRRRVPRVGGRVRQPLRHRAPARRRARLGGGRRPRARHRRAGRAAGARSGATDTVGVFVLPPSFEVLEQRLRGRSKDSEEAMQRRLRRRATKWRRSPNTTTSSSTTSSRRASIACAPSSSPSARGSARRGGSAKHIVERFDERSTA